MASGVVAAKWAVATISSDRILGGFVRGIATASLAATFGLAACHHAFVDRAGCAQDLRDYEDRIRMERDTVKQVKLISEADSDAALAGRGAQQRLVIHNLLAYSRSGLAPRGARTGKIAEFVCADSAQ
jgi:hypothetical protein